MTGGSAWLQLNQKQYIIKGMTCGIGIHLVFNTIPILFSFIHYYLLDNAYHIIIFQQYENSHDIDVILAHVS